MGNELDRLMLQYGIGTPSMALNPNSPVAPAANADKAAIDQYNANLTTYNANQQAYNNYANEYKARTLNVPQYLQEQYQTGYEPKSAGVQAAQPTGVQQLYSDIA